MEYAWGIAASKTPFPAEFASAARSKPKATSTSQPLPPPAAPDTTESNTTTAEKSVVALALSPTKTQSVSPPLPSSGSTRSSRLRIPGHSRPPLTHTNKQAQAQAQADPASRTSSRSRSNSSSGSRFRIRSRSRDQGSAAALMSPDSSRSPGLLSYDFLSRVSSHPAPSAPSALTHDDRRRPASATIASHLHRSRSRSGRSSSSAATTTASNNTSYTAGGGKPDRDAAAAAAYHQKGQQRPASTSAAVGNSATGLAATATANTSTTRQDKQLPALPTEASVSSPSSSPRRAPEKTCDAIDGYDDNDSTSYPGPLMSRASSTLSSGDGASYRDWQGDHNSAASATAPLLSAPPTPGPSSQHRRPPSLKPSSTAVCDASKKSRSPLSFSRSRAQHQLSSQHHHHHHYLHHHHPPNTPDSGISHRSAHNHELSRKPPSTHWANAASSTTPTSTDPPARKRDRRQSSHATMVGTESIVSSTRTESVAESLGGRTIMSSEPPYREGDGSSTRSLARPRPPFVTKSNGRTYLADPTLPYPLPVDLHELHRQSLRTLLLFQLFGGPLCSPFFNNKPPTRVLDLGCAYGFWSMMCHSYYSRKGFPNVHFTGLDIAALGGIAGMPHVTGPAGGLKDRISSTSTSSSSSAGHWAEQPPDKNMRWNFVQHDVRVLPLPFPDEEFDVIMCKDMSMSIPLDHFSCLIDDFMRLLKPGGVVEIWECDHPIRMLRPHVPDMPATGPGAAMPATPTTEDLPPNSPFAPTDAKTGAENASTPTTPATPANPHASSKKADYEKEVAELGAYVINNNTPLSGPQNNYLIEYNGWVSKYMDAHKLLAFPCANVGALFLQEPLLTNYGSKRMAIPLSEVRWEREGVGGVVTKDGKSYIDTSKAIGKAAAAAAAVMGNAVGSGAGGKRGSSAAGDGGDEGSKKGKALSAGQLALRQTALQTVVQMIEGLEPALREVSGKKPDEWDTWMGKLMKELLERDGASCGECLEVGAWWARKRQDPPPS
ncbi:hypothetical protein KVR01_009004 [Diaporthe batatas]|uniref:uncharacterized protein n=1 Tax=Diaporthe batatas TaxID=748121 RepID=UPI001D04C970|nr:uncharacterized protein KVR01_009004 [Diaporthe batatas]KAG8160740.1 hypothetical protein KVR01_009004 [Diaporthe batatas]